MDNNLNYQKKKNTFSKSWSNWWVKYWGPRSLLLKQCDLSNYIITKKYLIYLNVLGCKTCARKNLSNTWLRPCCCVLCVSLFDLGVTGAISYTCAKFSNTWGGRFLKWLVWEYAQRKWCGNGRLITGRRGVHFLLQERTNTDVPNPGIVAELNGRIFFSLCRQNGLIKVDQIYGWRGRAMSIEDIDILRKRTETLSSNFSQMAE